MILNEDINVVERPVSMSFKYTWAFFSANWKNSAIVAALLFVLFMLQAVPLPLIRVFASIAQGLILTSILFYLAHLFYASNSLEEFSKHASSILAKELLFEKIKLSVSLYLGVILSLLLLITISGVIIAIDTPRLEQMDTVLQEITTPNLGLEQQQRLVIEFSSLLFGGAFLIVILLWTIWSYVWILTIGYALSKNDAKEVFFVPTFWLHTLSWHYFKIIGILIPVLFFAIVLLGVCIATLILKPFGILILVWMYYYITINQAISYNLTKEI
jgi:hypothetical protein